ncbi:MAG TPA: molybdate ABC transporter substrate-binding protein [Tepidisphaeraceae bacterium]|jgi:molybdate transport system substrate-binding protein|nr:molybdate ABC transporter substrate-binding protein [Tepidisphaeraceae bacterium]
MSRTITFLLAVLLGALGCFGDQVTISAAISLKETLTDIANVYRTDTRNTADLNFGASGTLAVQIQQGAPVDLFISAGNKEVDALIKAGLVEPASRKVVAGNQLVLIVPADFANPPEKFDDLLDVRFHHVAIGEPKVVPAGQYAMQTLKALGLDEKLSSKLIMAENVRQVLSYVIRGEADAGLVYSTDARQAGDAVRVALTAGESTHNPIVYPAVVVNAGHHSQALKFLDYLSTDRARQIFLDHGFTVPAPQPTTRN